MKQRGSANRGSQGIRPAAHGHGANDDAALVTDRLSMLAEPVRLRLLRLLEREELTVGETAKVVQLPQSTVSRHLKILHEHGWLSRRSEGTAALYRLILDDVPDEARALWRVVREQLSGGVALRADLQRLEGVLAERRTDSLTYFGRVVGEWDAIRAELFGRGFTGWALPALLPSECVVADLGCGTGNASERLAPFVAKVIAIDQSAPMLEAARKRLDRFDNVEFRQGALEQLPIDDQSVDAATIVLVLHHVGDPLPALRECRRVLKPGGVLLVVDMQAHDRAAYRQTMGHRRLGFDEEEMRTALETAGFDRVRWTPAPEAPEAKGPGLFVATGRTAGPLTN